MKVLQITLKLQVSEHDVKTGMTSHLYHEQLEMINSIDRVYIKTKEDIIHYIEKTANDIASCDEKIDHLLSNLKGTTQ